MWGIFNKRRRWSPPEGWESGPPPNSISDAREAAAFAAVAGNLCALSIGLMQPEGRWHEFLTFSFDFLKTVEPKNRLHNQKITKNSLAALGRFSRIDDPTAIRHLIIASFLLWQPKTENRQPEREVKTDKGASGFDLIGLEISRMSIDDLMDSGEPGFSSHDRAWRAIVKMFEDNWSVQYYNNKNSDAYFMIGLEALLLCATTYSTVRDIDKPGLANQLLTYLLTSGHHRKGTMRTVIGRFVAQPSLSNDQVKKLSNIIRLLK
jgi:hypothetical protein